MSPQPPDPKILKNLMSMVENDFRVIPEKIFTKLIWIHLMTSVATLSVCQQFGLKWGFDFDLMHVFMAAGSVACQTLCAAFFMGSSFLMISLTLPRHEYVWLKKRSLWVGGVFSLSAVLFLKSMGSMDSLLLTTVWAIAGFLTILGILRMPKLNLWART